MVNSFTTGCWYYRLARAASDPVFSGALSTAIDALMPSHQRSVAASLDRLPDQVGLLSMRYLVPIMRHLDVGSRLNLLTAEALAAALRLEAGIRVTADSPLLRNACARLTIDHRQLVV